jgi:hypothetical protein
MAARGKNTIFRVTSIPIGARAENALKSTLDSLSPDDDKDSISILRSALAYGNDTIAFGEQEEDQQAESFLKAAILIELSSDERSSLKTRIEILPSCYHDNIRSALLHFRNGVPKFLQSSTNELVEECQTDVYDVDLNIDRNFYGFTQMYATAKNITVE